MDKNSSSQRGKWVIVFPLATGEIVRSSDNPREYATRSLARRALKHMGTKFSRKYMKYRIRLLKRPNEFNFAGEV